MDAKQVEFVMIEPIRKRFSESMKCQVIYESLHHRGWVDYWSLVESGKTIGYAAIVRGGPWMGQRAVFEFYLLPEYQNRIFDVFEQFRRTARPDHITCQTNCPQLPILLQANCDPIQIDSILFEAGGETFLSTEDFELVPMNPRWRAECIALQLEADCQFVLLIDQKVVGSGGWLSHYNPPYVDLYMQIAEPFRGQGYGALLVQEIKRMAIADGKTPAARCRPDNAASRRTLQRAGLVPCGLLLTGKLASKTTS
jgi:GNAT superfamily N-acetyltransferase